MNDILQGDCLEILKTLPDNSVDAVITDPPYELGFMGKGWDKTGIANSVEMWGECLRVLKPGGHLLSFSGTRTYHRMACAIEDAGFEVRDMIEWCYGSGFPKSLNIGKSVNQLETNEWSKIGKALDNIDQKSIIEIWKGNSNNVKIVETQSLKNQIIAGQDTLSENFVVLSVAQNNNQESSNLIVSFAERNLNEAPAINTKTNTALLSVKTEIRQLQNNVKSAEQQSQNQSHKSWSIFTAQCDVKEWLKENTMVSLKVDEVLKILRGNKKYSNEEIINVLNAVIPSVLKHTILNQSKTFQNLDTNQKMECVSAINVIITEYTAENLISNTVDILKGKAVDKLQGNEREFVCKNPANRPYNLTKGETSTGWQSPPRPDKDKGSSPWEGWGTALKPSHEPICMARKPLSEKTVAENILKWGTGGINIDESRVWTDDKPITRFNKVTDNFFSGKKPIPQTPFENGGRFPANLIHDNSEEVRECFPETKGEIHNKKSTGNSMFMGDGVQGSKRGFSIKDSGNASRFFKSILYYPKASKSERNKNTNNYLIIEICVDNMEVAQLQPKVILEKTELWFTELFGKEKMEEYQMDFKSTIKTETKKTTILIILNYSQHLNIKEYIVGAIKTKMESGGNHAVSVENTNEWRTIIIDGLMEYLLGVNPVVYPTQLKIRVNANNFHSTVKPIALMEYLIKMVSREGQTILDPFAGSGTTLVAAKQLGRNFIGIEKEAEYLPIITARVAAVNQRQEVLF